MQGEPMAEIEAHTQEFPLAALHASNNLPLDSPMK